MNAIIRWMKRENRRLAALTILRRQVRRYDIAQATIAAACRPPVDPSLVSHVLAGRARSQRVVSTAKRLIARARDKGAGR